MSRNLSPLVTAEVAKEKLLTFHLVQFQFDSGAIYFSTLHRSVVFESNTYIASATFMNFGNVVETESVELGSMQFTLSGVDLSVVAQALLEEFIDRPVLLYRAFLDTTTYEIITDPFLIYEGRITSFKMAENIDSATSTLTWQTASMWSDFNRTAGRRTNDNDQQIYFPGDQAFEYAHQITFDVRWGRV